MTVYKVFFRILYKQKMQVLMYLGIFFGIAVIMSSQGEETQTGMFQAQSQKIAVFDEDDSELSRGMAEYLAEGNERVELEDEAETIQDELYNRNIHCVIRIPKGYGESVVNGDVRKPQITTIPGTLSEQFFINKVSRYSSVAGAYRAGGLDARQIAEKTAAICKEKVSVSLSEGGREEQHGYMYYFFAYFPYIFISISVVGIGSILVVFHKKEVRERNICSCYPLLRTNLELYSGMVIAEIVFCLCYVLVVFLGMKCDTKLFGFQGMLYCLNMLCFMVVTLGIVFLVGQVVKRSTVLSMVSNIVSLGMSFLCGIFVPLEYLGEGLVRAAHFLPAYWYITSADMIDHYAAGQELGGLFRGMGIQLLFGAAFVCVGLAYSKAKMTVGQRE